MLTHSGPIATSREGVLLVPGPTALHHGGKLEDLQIGWTLSCPAGEGLPDGDPARPVVLALGGISASRRVFDDGGNGSSGKGWWQEIVGPGKALDTTRIALLGMDYIGSSEASTGPNGRSAFPSISSYDQADAIVKLMDHLGIRRLGAIVGASYGGMVALAFGERYPERVERLVVISAADVPHPMATAWRSVQRSIVRLGIEAKEPTRGLELARALAMSTYRSAEEFAARFRAAPRLDSGRAVFPVEEYLHARGRDYAAKTLPESFLCLSESIDLHNVDATKVLVRTEVVAVREDQLVPLADMRALTARLPDASLHEISSLMGHDAFLKEAEQLRSILAVLTPGDST